MKKVEAERFGRWLKDPVTRMYMERLEEIEKELISECGNGGCFNKNRPLEDMYHFFQGAISSINKSHDPHSIMADMIISPEEPENDPA